MDAGLALVMAASHGLALGLALAWLGARRDAHPVFRWFAATFVLFALRVWLRSVDGWFWPVVGSDLVAVALRVLAIQGALTLLGHALRPRHLAALIATGWTLITVVAAAGLDQAWWELPLNALFVVAQIGIAIALWRRPSPAASDFRALAACLFAS